MVAGQGLWAPVSAIPSRPPLVGLVPSAYIPPPDEVDDYGRPVGDRWVDGFAWRPGPGSGIVGRDDCDPTGAGVQLTPTSTIGIRYYQPYVIEAVASCSTMGLGAESYDYLAARARDTLLANESAAIARELMTGLVARRTGREQNLYLQSPRLTVLNPSVSWSGGTLTGAIAGNAVTAKRGLAMLEQALGQARGGMRGMIHVPREMVQPLGVATDGNLLVSNLKTIIVPDAGYDGTGPDGSTPPAGCAWSYATDLVSVRRSAIVTTPETGDDLAQMIARDVNTAAVSAWRYAAATYDGYAEFAVLTTLD